ncbi:uncharacterized protein LOC106012482 [Aplysia californica]|uniref:Uncharacterized protein LOC106012482 n=1 Tax=Aplysia californica TaxID=6500 RepID=A0ABM1A543_APLCA|nr:uncharacterized protein LOC106012482 [Aplysia californica]
MRSLILLCVFAPLVMSDAVDVTTICLPKQISGKAFNLVNDTQADYAFDFGLNKAAAKLPTGERYVVDLSTRQGYMIDTQDVCAKFAVGIFDTVAQCLPANAVALGQMTGGLGATQTTLDVFQVQLDANSISQILVDRESNVSLPVIRRDFSTVSGTRLTLFANPSLSIPDATIFNIPAAC